MTVSFQYAKRLSKIPCYERDGKSFLDDAQLVSLIEELFTGWNLNRVTHAYNAEKDVMLWKFADGSSLTITNGYQHHGMPATYQARG